MSIIAVDFDGTIAIHEFPSIGEPIKGSIEGIKRLHELGHDLILWTCREGEYLTDAIEWLSRKKVDYCFKVFNENLPEIILEMGDTRKIFYNFLIDDRNFAFHVNWLKIIEYVERNF